jgi:hypothetical protein
LSLPNFIIVGAPKAGSTSLWRYLIQHPEVFPTSVKEPGFFWEQRHTRKGKTRTLEEYEALFEGSESYAAVGEASPGYLVDEKAPARIAETIPNVKLIAILRDPCARAFSEFVFQRMRNDEPEADFLSAIGADEERPSGRRFEYVATGLYYENLSRYLRVFPRDQLEVILTDDFKSNADGVLRTVFEYLGIDPDVKVDTQTQFTVSGLPKNKAMHWLLGGNNALKRNVGRYVPAGLTRALRRVRNANLERQSMTSEERAALLPRFEADILQLEELLERDLASWRSVV